MAIYGLLCRAERLYGNIWLHTVFSCTAAAAGADADAGAATAGAAAAVPGSPLVSRTRAHLRSSSWISGMLKLVHESTREKKSVSVPFYLTSC